MRVLYMQIALHLMLSTVSEKVPHFVQSSLTVSAFSTVAVFDVMISCDGYVLQYMPSTLSAVAEYSIMYTVL